MVKALEIAKTPLAAMDLVTKKGFSYIAGGTEINRLNSDLKIVKAVSIQNLPFGGIGKFECEHGEGRHQHLKIGSLCTFEECLESEDVPDDLKVAIRFNSSLQKRNMATIGGNIASLRDDSYLIPTLAALYAKLVIYKKKEPVEILDYVRKKDKKELIEAIMIPLCTRRASSYRISNTAASHAVITMSVGCCGGKGGYKNPVAVAAIKGCGIIELKDIEKEIISSNDINPEKLQQIVVKSRISLKDDPVYASAEFRKYELGASMFLVCEKLREMFG